MKKAQGIEIPNEDELWVKVNLKLVNWTFDTTTVVLRATSTLYSLVRRIKEKHGNVQELALYKGQVNPSNQMEDWDATFLSLGFDGVPNPDDAKAVNVYFDFKPILKSNPLLLVTPRTH